eukprot:CAMPEP_0205905712 /NCGR_PEP_ID=MMETSP1325-20131115/1507_1 /ASSEMBLY_ACC=CAM_ASM_000708 /TAXON_ID=236786 /ORGANISM="Florenciella sp., Strain RCC1007" /LENGTH=385 /DNA_ID=CAMNT_0053271643 /DNA_START=39 /DNA_END=1196 /DNA_ORIENTATION=-
MAGMQDSLSAKYSKWDNIELSDDESDCHPNIDKDSWFRMKHRSRVEREENEDAEKQKLTAQNKGDEERLAEVRERLAEEEEEEDKEALEEEIKDLEASIAKRQKRLDEMEANKKWNVDNMCHVVEERTIVSNKSDTTKTSELPAHLVEAQKAREAARAAEAGELPVGPRTERKEIENYADFVNEYEDLLEKYIDTHSMEECKQLMHMNGDVLLQENASSYLLLSCLEEEMNGNHEKMRHVARQSQILSHITELAASLKRAPRDVVLPFFNRIAEDEHRRGFQEAVDGFITRIQKRAVDKRKEMDEEEKQRRLAGEGEEEVELSKEERMGPGGLDPVEVFESLPESMQDAFESKDMQKLQEALQQMPIEEVKYHMKRCEDSGLWVK